jgi:hypothetical protein
MSRQLPQKANLEYLKKQAKELPSSMRQGKLADVALTEGLPMIPPEAVDICRPMMVRYSGIYRVTG